MYNVFPIEERNKPTATLCNKGFSNDAIAAASSKGMPGLRIVSENVPCECNVMEDIEAGVNAAMDDIVAALTKPLTAEERSPKPKEVEKPPRIIFKGNLQEVNQFFYRRGWTDGLPIIPPTEEAVSEMLTGTDLPPNHSLGKLLPRLGKATVEKIAINAVMAGALPTYMPLLIAGLHANMDSKAHGNDWGVSTGSWAPFWIINGPIRNELHVNNGTGALSPGDIANAAIGRALGMIIKNIRGLRKGVEDMGTLGNPMKYSLVVAENEEESPWEPLHVEQGFNKEDSTISLSFPHIYNQLGAYDTDDYGILNALIYNPGTRSGLHTIMLIPAHARMLAENGWTKKDIKGYISEYARVPLYKMRRGSVAFSTSRLPVNPLDSVSVIPDPDAIRIIVAGGGGNMIGILKGGPIYSSKGEEPEDMVTRKVELPANWSTLVAK